MINTNRPIITYSVYSFRMTCSVKELSASVGDDVPVGVSVINVGVKVLSVGIFVIIVGDIVGDDDPVGD